MSPLTVALDACDAASAGEQRSILASVPGRFRIGEAAGADVAVVSGRSPDWLDGVARAVESGARAVVVVRPAPADPERVRQLSRAVAGRAVVAVDTPYAADPAWAAVAGEVAADTTTASIVDSVVSVPAGAGDELPGALLAQLAVVRPLVGLAGGVRAVDRGEGRYVLIGRGPGPRVSLTGVTSAAGDATLALDVVAPARRWRIRFDDAAPARPTRITRYDGTGAYGPPLIHAGGRRETWQRLYRALTAGGAVGYPLDQLAEDLVVAAQVFPAA